MHSNDQAEVSQEADRRPELGLVLQRLRQNDQTSYWRQRQKDENKKLLKSAVG